MVSQVQSFSYRSSPFTLFLQDVGLLFGHLFFVPHILLPLVPSSPQHELAIISNPKNLLAIFNLFVLTVLSLVASAGAIVLSFVVPAVWVGAWIGLWIGVFQFQHWWSSAASSDPYAIIKPEKDWDEKEMHREESWLYINGVCTGRIWCQSNVDMLSEIFKRNVTGIHNKTNGLFFDLIECLLQREWIYGTQDAVPLLYTKIKDALLNEKKKKVVVVAHSQGAIILSFVIDWLLADLPEAAFQKLEIYTFACAANHFNSPKSALNHPTIKIVEHYANGKDPACFLGLLSWWKTDGPERGAGEGHARFAGQLFLRPKNSGHLLNQHYLQSTDPRANWPALSTQKHPPMLWNYVGGKKPEFGGRARRYDD